MESLSADAKGAPTALLSRRKVQEQAMEEMRRSLKPGAVVVGKVVRMEPFGAFVDIGRGIVALLPTEYISTSGSGWGRKFWQWSRSLTGKTGGSP